MKPSEAKRILEGYVEHGYVSRVGMGDFEVTKGAANRFAFAELDELLQPAGGSVDLVGAAPLAGVNPFDAPSAIPPLPPGAVPLRPAPPPIPTAEEALGVRAAIAPVGAVTRQFYGGGDPQ
jgi:hypothetical protein